MPEVTKISHGLTIGDFKFGNARPGVVEASLRPGETMEDALDELDERLTAWHKKRYPHLYETQPSPIPERPFAYRQEQTPVISKDKQSESDRIGTMIADIYSCSEIKVLEGYRLLAKTKPEFQAAYDQQMKKLSNGLE